MSIFLLKILEITRNDSKCQKIPIFQRTVFHFSGVVHQNNSALLVPICANVVAWLDAERLFQKRVFRLRREILDKLRRNTVEWFDRSDPLWRVEYFCSIFVVVPAVAAEVVVVGWKGRSVFREGGWKWRVEFGRLDVVRSEVRNRVFVDRRDGAFFVILFLTSAGQGTN